MILARFSIIIFLFGLLSLGCGEKKSPTSIPTGEVVTEDGAETEGEFSEDDSSGEYGEDLSSDYGEDEPYGDVIEDDVADGAGADWAADIPADAGGGGIGMADMVGLIGPLMGMMQGMGGGAGPAIQQAAAAGPATGGCTCGA